MAKKKIKKKRKKSRLWIEWLVLGLLAAATAGAGFGLLQRPPTPQTTATTGTTAPVVETTPTEPKETKRKAPETKTTATKTKPSVVVPEIIRDPFSEVADLLDPTRSGKAEPLPMFDPARLRDYADDGGETRLRRAVREGIRQLKALDPLIMNRRLSVPAKGTLAELLESLQKKTTMELDRLELLQSDLRSLIAERKEEPKRWQANYDFVAARTLAHQITLQELAAQVRSVRAQVAKGKAVPAGGWELFPDAALNTGDDTAALASEREKLLLRLAEEQRGTPWEVVGAREKALALGVRAKPVAKKP